MTAGAKETEAVAHEPEVSDAPSEESETEQSGPLEFLGKLGDGRYADVYRALDKRLEREVAVKIIKPEGAGSTDALTQARALARVKHPNVGVVHAVEEVRDPANGETVSAVVMELIDGDHLDKVLDHGALDPGRARSIGIGILDGLAADLRALGPTPTDLALDGLRGRTKEALERLRAAAPR